LWPRLVGHFKISLVSSVINEARHYIDPSSQVKKDIDLTTSITTKKIAKIAIDISEISKVLKMAQENKLEIHRGEAESIAALSCPQYNGFFFCTSDQAAVLIAHLCGILNRIVSLEGCLTRTGTHKKILSKLPGYHSEKVMKKWKAEAICRFPLKLGQEK
jgi:hypothetical protein